MAAELNSLGSAGMGEAHIGFENTRVIHVSFLTTHPLLNTGYVSLTLSFSSFGASSFHFSFIFPTFFKKC